MISTKTTFRLAILSMAILATGCGKEPQNTEYNPLINVSTIVMGQSDDTNTRTYVGEMASDMEMSLSFPLGGQLTELYVENGQRVKKGQLLARVDDTSMKSLHDGALATLRQAEDGYARLKQVHEGGGVSDVRWVQMETDLEKARQAEISTRKHLEDCSLYAPQDGVVSMSDHRTGEDLAPLQPLCKLLDMNHMHIEFSVPEKEVSLVSEGDLGSATLPSQPDKRLEVTVSDKGLLANPMGHTYRIKAKVTKSDGANLMIGQVAKVHLSSTAPQGLIVPSWCIQTQADGLSVWMVRNGKAHRTHIEVASYVKNGVLISSGLAAGDTVVTDGYQKLYEGAEVTINN